MGNIGDSGNSAELLSNMPVQEPTVPASEQTLTHAVGVCIAELLMADSVIAASPNALEKIAKIARIDRLLFNRMKRNASGGQMITTVVWAKAGTEKRADPSLVINNSPDRDALDQWALPLREGRPIVASRRSSSVPVQNLLRELNIQSVLLVPITVAGGLWGSIGFDACFSERDWTPEEITILTILAELIGVAIMRERSTEELRSRDALLEAVTSSAVKIMTAPDLKEAISQSLEAVSRALSTDRMLVLETTPAANGHSENPLRYGWHRPGTSIDMTAIGKAMASPTASDIGVWLEPLRHGQIVSGSLQTVTGAVKEHFGQVELQSTLIVPIMLDGKLWGQINVDDRSKERSWTTTEVDILKTLAELIGTAITRERYVEELGKANTIVQNSPTILYRLRGEPSFRMIYVSQNVEMLGYDRAELINSPTLYQSYVHVDDRTKVQTAMVELLRKDAPPVCIEYRMLTQSADIRWLEARYTPVREPDGRLIEVEGIMIDITERKLAEEKIALLARTDALTGLANRATFGDRLRQAFASAKRGANPFALLFLDLDRFKEVNDTFGHPAGDRVLQMVAERLKEVTRETDLAARLGGDEFAILQADVTDPEAVGTLALKLISSLSAPYPIADNEARIGVSVGIAVFSQDAADPEALLARADQALYRAKDEGRGQHRFHSEILDAESRASMALSRDLRQALENDELELYYQPQVELLSGRIVGMEALVRWNHPTRGLLLPDSFIPAAEKSGFIQALGRWVLDRACRQMSIWKEENVPLPVLAVNVGLGQVKAGAEFVQSVKDSLDRWKLTPSDLQLDVTEFILARTRLAQSDVLDQLRRLGVGIAIDDFGAQYSSLEYLRTYQVNRLKIARPVVAAAADDGDGAATIRAIMSLAAELGVEVVAEGVETKDQREALIGLSSKTKGQGFHFSRPVPAEDTLELLRLGIVAPSEPKAD